MMGHSLQALIPLTLNSANSALEDREASAGGI